MIECSTSRVSGSSQRTFVYQNHQINASYFMGNENIDTFYQLFIIYLEFEKCVRNKWLAAKRRRYEKNTFLFCFVSHQLF